MEKSILLISPDFDVESFWISEEEGTCAEVLNDVAPLGLATIAGMTGEEFHVDIWDEVVHGRIGPDSRFRREYDLVGITGYGVHFRRCRELANLFRRRGILVAIGGPGVSSEPDRYRAHFDILFIGEAEVTWRQFLADWSAGDPKDVYRQIEKLDLASSPLPKWDSIAADMGKYALGAVQTTRGCPFDCEFCDVIYLFGRKSRHKPIDNVLQEVIQMQRHGLGHVLFCDDEFIGDPSYAKELLRALIPLNNAIPRPLSFVTQLTMNLSRDTELLELVADANFGLVFIGIETPNKEALKETGKYQNIRVDLVADVRKILSYGIPIRAGLIVGFDHDHPDVFDLHDEFVHRTCVPSTTLSMLKAIPGTRLWRRLRGEGRVLDITQIKGDTKGMKQGFKPRSYTNIIPGGMSRIELMTGYRRLAERLYSWDSFSTRMRGFVSGVRRLPNVAEGTLTENERQRLSRAGRDNVDAARAIEEIVAHTDRVAPSLLPRVRTLIMQHTRHFDTFQKLLPYIDRLVEKESSGQLAFPPDNRRVPVPEAFRHTYESMFLNVYRRLYANLAHREHLPRAATEVFVDFLARRGDRFRGLEDHHLDFLEQLCDRTCAKLNGVPPQDFRPKEPEGVPDSEVKRWRLSEDVMRSVEQELVRLGVSVKTQGLEQFPKARRESPSMN